jgi:hypothetical protein
VSFASVDAAGCGLLGKIRVGDASGQSSGDRSTEALVSDLRAGLVRVDLSP